MTEKDSMSSNDDTNAAIFNDVNNATTTTTMFASVCTQYGPAGDVFELRRDFPRPKLLLPAIASSRMLLIRNEMTSVNPADCKQRSGNLRLIAKHDFPLVLGQDFCGRVVEVGPKVTKLKVGDIVMGSTAPRNSCSAEYVLVFESECAKIDLQDNEKETGVAGMSTATAATAVTAAATPTAYCTAWKGLFDSAYGNLSVRDDLEELCKNDSGGDNADGAEEDANNKKDGEAAASPRGLSVLVIGASGSVGSAAVQLAVGVAVGIKKVVGICGTKNLEYVRSLENDKVKVEAIDYHHPDWYEKRFLQQNDENKFDLILDCVGGDEYYYKLYPILKNYESNPHASYVTCVGPVLHGGSNPITVRTLLKTAATLIPRLLGNYVWPKRSKYNSRYKIYLGFETTPALETIARLLEKGVICPRIDPASPIPLKELGKAHELVETGHSNGKVVVEIQVK